MVCVDKMDRLHPTFAEDYLLFIKAAKLAFDVSRFENLELVCVVPKKRISSSSALGLCYIKSKIIAITIRHRTDVKDGGKWAISPLPWKIINETILHEVAHLKFANHSKEFKIFEEYLIGKYSIL